MMSLGPCECVWRIPPISYQAPRLVRDFFPGFLNLSTIDILGHLILCPVHCKMLSSSCDNQKCLQILPSAPWEAKSALVENHWSNLRTRPLGWKGWLTPWGCHISSSVVEREVSKKALSPAVSGPGGWETLSPLPMAPARLEGTMLA